MPTFLPPFLAATFAGHGVAFLVLWIRRRNVRYAFLAACFTFLTILYARTSAGLPTAWNVAGHEIYLPALLRTLALFSAGTSFALGFRDGRRTAFLLLSLGAFTIASGTSLFALEVSPRILGRPLAWLLVAAGGAVAMAGLGTLAARVRPLQLEDGSALPGVLPPAEVPGRSGRAGDAG